MELSKASGISGESCLQCGGDTRWRILGNYRNYIVALLHFMSFIVGIIALIISNDLWLYFIILFALAVVTYFFRQLYKSSLICESCGVITKHRDILNIFHKI